MMRSCRRYLCRLLIVFLTIEGIAAGPFSSTGFAQTFQGTGTVLIITNPLEYTQENETTNMHALSGGTITRWGDLTPDADGLFGVGVDAEGEAAGFDRGQEYGMAKAAEAMQPVKGRHNALAGRRRQVSYQVGDVKEIYDYVTEKSRNIQCVYTGEKNTLWEEIASVSDASPSASLYWDAGEIVDEDAVEDESTPSDASPSDAAIRTAASPSLSPDLIQKYGIFLDQITAMESEVYGDIKNCDLDGDGKTAFVFHDFTEMDGGEEGNPNDVTMGYFLAEDMEDTSGEGMDMLHVNIDGVSQISDEYVKATLAHELQHLIRYGNSDTTYRWINEMLSQSAADLCGEYSSNDFDIEQMAYRIESNGISPCILQGPEYFTDSSGYGQLTLLARYLKYQVEPYLPESTILWEDYVNYDEDITTETLDRYLKDRTGKSLDEWLGDFSVALYLNDVPSEGENRINSLGDFVPKDVFHYNSHMLTTIDQWNRSIADQLYPGGYRIMIVRNPLGGEITIEGADDQMKFIMLDEYEAWPEEPPHETGNDDTSDHDSSDPSSREVPSSCLPAGYASSRIRMSSYSAADRGYWILDETGWWFVGLNREWPVQVWREYTWNGKKQWYYFDEKGYLASGWVTIDNRQYYLNPEHNGEFGAWIEGEIR